MKKWIGAVSAGIAVMASVTPVAFAAQTKASTTQATSETIALNNESLSAPHILNKDGDAYIPVWYVMQALNTLGIQSKWNGSSWHLTALGITNLPTTTSGQGNVTVYLNGQKLFNVQAVSAIDPASNHPTTYLRIKDITTVLNSLNLTSEQNGNTWDMLTPDVKALADAFSNTAAAPQSQATATMVENIQLNLTDKGKADLKGQPSNMKMTMNMNMVTGTVNGEKAAEVTITPSVPAASATTSTNTTGAGTANTSANSSASAVASALPKTIQEYIQGSRVWTNMGKGWVEQKATEQMIQSLESQLPTSEINFTGLRNIQSKQAGNVTTYTATIDGSNLEQEIAPVMQEVAASAGSTGISSKALATFMNKVIEQLKGSLQISVQSVNNKNLITAEQMTMHLNLPVSELPKPSAGATTGTTANTTGTTSGTTSGNTTTTTANAKATAASEITSIDIDETMQVNYTYNNVTLTPPAGLNTSTTTANTTTATK